MELFCRKKSTVASALPEWGSAMVWADAVDACCWVFENQLWVLMPRACCWLLETNRRQNHHFFLSSSVQNTVNQMQTLGLIKKHKSITFLLVSWLWHRQSSKSYAQKCRLPDHVYGDASPWQLHQPRNGFLNDYSISSNRATLAMSIVTLYLLSELGFQFSRSLEFSYSSGQIRALN